MPALRDKVWVRKDGRTWKADICRVSDDRTIDANLYAPAEPDEVGIVNDMIVGGVANLTLAADAQAQETDGSWWPRAGQFVIENGRRRWDGE